MSSKASSLVFGKSAKGGQVVFQDDGSSSLCLHVVGAPGTGKSKFLEYLIRQDIKNKHGCVLLDPHGYLYNDVLRWCTARGYLGKRKIVLFDLSQPGWTFGFNPLHSAPDLSAASNIVDAMVEAFAQVWGGEETTRTPQLRTCLRAVLHILAQERLTLPESMPLFSSTDPGHLREFLTRDVSHPVMRDLWADFNKMSQKEFRETFASTGRRIIEFIEHEKIAHILGQQEDVIDYRKIMDEGYIVLVNLGGAVLTEERSRLLGTLMISDIFARARERSEGSRPFRLYIDECHRFLTRDIQKIIIEGRKFGVHAILAHQNLGQVREEGDAIYRAITGIQNRVVFAVNDPDDAEYLARIVFAGELNYEKVKHTFDKPTAVGFKRTRLGSESHTAGTSETSGETIGDGHSSGDSTTSYEDSESSSSSSGSSYSSAHSESVTTSESTTMGFSEALEPILENMPSQGYSLEELRDMATARIQNLSKAIAIAKLEGSRSVELHVPWLKPGAARDERVSRFKAGVLQITDFAKPRARIEAELKQRRLELEAKAQEFRVPKEPETFGVKRERVVKSDDDGGKKKK